VITSGIDAAGMPLGTSMPRYRMSGPQLDALIDYVQVLGTPKDNDPGIERDAIKIGAALPLTGPMAATGMDVAAVLKARFDRVNEAGGIYGRRLVLVVADCGDSADEILAATQHLVTEQNVFALVASFQPVEHDALDAWIAAAQVPLIGPVGQAAHEIRSKDAMIWQLLPTLNDQARVLVDYVMSRPTPIGIDRPKRIAIIRTETPGVGDAVTGATAQLARYGASVITAQIAISQVFFATDAAHRILEEKPEHILFFGGSSQLKAFAEVLYAGDSNAAPIAALILLSAARDMPESLASKLVWAYPGEPTDEVQWTKLINRSKGVNYSANSSAFQAVAFAAAAVLQESLMRSGRRLSRDSLAKELDGLYGFESGVLPAVEFRPGYRIGSRGASIVQFDNVRADYIAKWSWRSPSTAFH
jgi:ABC-type branched-subunit amino acid transport system substrate-binding protein